MFQALCTTWLPGVEVINVVDESLIRNTIAAGHVEKVTAAWTLRCAWSAGDRMGYGVGFVVSR